MVTSDKGNVIVLLTDSTTTKDNKGILGARNDEMATVVLIPGLKVDVDGASNEQGSLSRKPSHSMATTWK